MVSENATRDEDGSENKKDKAELLREYRKVGPAAINAALQCKPKAKEKEPKRSYEPHEEI